MRCRQIKVEHAEASASGAHPRAHRDADIGFLGANRYVCPVCSRLVPTTKTVLPSMLPFLSTFPTTNHSHAQEAQEAKARYFLTGQT